MRLLIVLRDSDREHVIFVTGSTFRVGVVDEVNPNKVQCYGAGIDPKGVRSGQPATFTVDASQAGEAPVECNVTNPRGECPRLTSSSSVGVCVSITPTEMLYSKINVGFTGL